MARKSNYQITLERRIKLLRKDNDADKQEIEKLQDAIKARTNLIAEMEAVRREAEGRAPYANLEVNVDATDANSCPTDEPEDPETTE